MRSWFDAVGELGLKWGGSFGYGVSVKECDLVGMVPIEALEEMVSYYLQIPGFTSKQIIEYHIPPD